MPVFAPSGQSLGNARGTITLDTSQLVQAVATARALAEQLERNLEGVGDGARKAQNGFAQMTVGLRDLRGELLAIGAGAGLLTKMGLDGALNLRNYTLAFRQFVGSQKEAVDLTNRLIDAANKYGLEWEGVAQLGRALLPSLKDGEKSLDAWISRAARLRSLFPAAPRGSETIAISEFLAGQFTSISRRFNVPMTVINEARQKFTDLGQALDYILERRGATEEAAQGMANAFVGVRNELSLLLATGFTPLFQALQPVLASMRQFASDLRETSPGFTTAVAGMIALTAATVPTVLIFNQLAIAAEKLKALGILGGLGRAGGVGLAVGAGVGLGIGVNQVIGQATGDEERANRGLDRLLEVLRASLALLGKVLIDGAMLINKAITRVVQSFVWAAGQVSRGLGEVWTKLGSMLPAGMGGQAFADAGKMLNMSADKNQDFNKLLDSYLTRMEKGANAITLGLFKTIAPEQFADSKVMGAGPDTGARDEIVGQWAKDVARIERDAAEARLQAVQDFERQRADMIAQYNLSALREQEDYERGRARAVANFNRQVAEFQQDAARREATWQRDYNEKIAELRADGNERLQELEEDYNKDRERAERDHRNRLLDAAARLDAVAVREEIRRFADQTTDAEDGYKERVDKERENLDERIAEEQKAHVRRLQDQRDANAERLEDMQRAFAEQTAEEDFERQLRLQRQAEDFATQLAQQDVAHAERLAQISRQAAQERAAVDESFMEQLNQLGIFNQGWLTAQKTQQDAALRLFNEWWGAIQQKIAASGPQPQRITSFAGYASGGPVAGTGPALLHANEYVLNAQTTAALRSRMGGFDQRSLVGAVGARSVTIGDINIETQPGMDTVAIGREVERRLVAILEDVAR
jgi:hypothetical protein